MYKFHEDAGHGWLEVPISELKEKGIENKVSKCSYIDKEKGLVYLEEDCDMPLFCGDDYGIEYETIYTEDSFVRKLERYK